MKTIVLYFLWVLVGWILSAVRCRIYWRAQAKPKTLFWPLLSALFWYHRFFPLLFIILVILSARLWWHHGFLLWMLVLLPFAADVLLSWYRVCFERKASGCDSAKLRREALMRDMRNTMTILCMLLCLAFFPLFPILALVAAYVLLRVIWVRPRSRALLDLTDTPLADEILRIYQRVNIYMEKVAVDRLIWSQRIGALLVIRASMLHRKVHLSAQSIQRLNSTALTAGLCLRQHGGGQGPGPRGQSVVAGCLVSVLLLVPVILIGELIHLRSSWEFWPQWIWISHLGLLLALMLSAVLDPNSRNTVGNGYVLWCLADPLAERTPEDYVAALAECHAYQWAIRDPALVVHQLRFDASMRRFLTRHFGKEHEGVLVSVRHRIEPLLQMSGSEGTTV